MSEDASSAVNVIAVTFKEDASADEALTKLKELESQRQIGMRGAAVVARDETVRSSSRTELPTRASRDGYRRFVAC